MKPLLLALDAVTVPVPDLEAGLGFYRERLHHQLLWRNDAVGQAALLLPESKAELVLTTQQSYEPDWLVESADRAAEIFAGCGGEIVSGPLDIPIGRLVVVKDPFGNALVLLDTSKGHYQTGEKEVVVGIGEAPTLGAALTARAGADDLTRSIRALLGDRQVALSDRQRQRWEAALAALETVLFDDEGPGPEQ